MRIPSFTLIAVAAFAIEAFASAIADADQAGCDLAAQDSAEGTDTNVALCDTATASSSDYLTGDKQSNENLKRASRHFARTPTSGIEQQQ